MLVLTTMFISVSNNLPTTAYIKMIDVWLIFTLLIPFLLVLLHTYMDSLRTEASENEEERTINHHGKTISVSDVGLDSQAKTIAVATATTGDRIDALVHRNEVLELKVNMKTYGPLSMLLTHFLIGKDRALREY